MTEATATASNTQETQPHQPGEAMHTGFWFNRIIEYWNLPTADLVLDHVRRGKVQVVQVGNFGVDFYGLADDPDVVRQ